ncbi:hypothetical protein H4J38_04585 [Colwellia sp. BRX10-3]|uniref:hypothetical protein n=1 Tax=Colwellia sp. BRX10-3 TaxID=2759844 RepID=UPI0015F535BF|nr:hypothetical protein [Colwellia sp. BRX10-3]MBA6390057.1 hypothetical protein [Colwellia sp. BRX10-3]
MKYNSLLTLAILALLSLTSQAGTSHNSLEKCAKIEDNLVRLACFDDLAQQVEVSAPVNIVTKSSHKVATAKVKTITAPTTKKAENFGAEHLKAAEVAEEDLQIVFTIEQLSKVHYGKWLFTFTNGQQWKQADSEYLKLKVGDSVMLTKGFLNAVYLKKNEPDSNKKIRVKRLK